MFFVTHVKQNNHTGILKLKPASEIIERLTVRKRLQNAGGSIKILDILDGKVSKINHNQCEYSLNSYI